MNENTSPKPAPSLASSGSTGSARAQDYRRFCTQCRAHVSAGDRFCSRCGHAMDATGDSVRASAANQGARSPGRPVFTPALKTPEGMAVAAAIDARRTRLTRIAQISVSVAISVGIAAYLSTAHAASLWPHAFGIWACGTAFATTLAWVALDMRAWSERDYYSVPGSRDEQGEHRCIVCGHRGIYRHGKYKSDAEYADCAKCKTTLWVGTK